MKRIALVLVTILLVACSTPDSTPPEATDAETPEEIHDRILTIDAHADAEIPEAPSRYVGPDGRSRVAPDKMVAGGLDSVVLAVAVGPGPRDADGYAAARATADAELAAVVALAEDPANNATVTRSADELVAAHDAGQRGLVLGFQNALILGTEPDEIETFFDAGVRVFALTHMGHNDFADSSRPLFIGETDTYEATEEHGGLSDLGRAAIDHVNRLGGVVDISQLSRAAKLEVLERSTAPVIASHSNVKALCDVNRNMTDEEIDAVGANGGVVHISAFKGYLFDSTDEELDARIRAARAKAGINEDYDYPFELYWELPDEEAGPFVAEVSEILGPGSIQSMVDHIDYVASRIGIDHVGIGTDFNHGSGVEDFQDASGAINVTRALLDRGYSAEDVEKIWGGNFLRVWRAAEAAAE
ncbi:MAG: membrane dipeptidase [Acidobacteriota bacterium]